MTEKRLVDTGSLYYILTAKPRVGWVAQLGNSGREGAWYWADALDCSELGIGFPVAHGGPWRILEGFAEAVGYDGDLWLYTQQNGLVARRCAGEVYALMCRLGNPDMWVVRSMGRGEVVDTSASAAWELFEQKRSRGSHV